MSEERRQRRAYTAAFKQQMVDLYHLGKRKVDLIREYDLTESALERWIKQSESTGSFNHADNLTLEEKEIRRLKKRLIDLELENEILKSAALILGQRKK